MEVPFLACSTILSLDDKISTKIVDIFTETLSGNDMEVSVNLEAPISIPLTLGWFSLPVFGIDEVPLLMDFT
jgi:hypothetical protein